MVCCALLEGAVHGTPKMANVAQPEPWYDSAKIARV